MLLLHNYNGISHILILILIHNNSHDNNDICLIDRPMKEWDKKVSTFLLKQAVEGAGSKTPLSNGEKGLFVGKREWDLNKLRQYIGDDL